MILKNISSMFFIIGGISLRKNFSFVKIVRTLLVAGVLVFSSGVVIKDVQVHAVQSEQIIVQAVQADRSSPQPPNGPINISVTSNSTGEALYRFWIYDGWSWRIVQDYSKQSTYRWIPERAGTYRIWVDGKALNSRNDYDSYKEIIYSVNNVTTGVTFDKAAPQPSNSKIKITAKATGTNSPLFKFWIYDGWNWKVVQDYSTSAEFSWTPERSGNYRVWVDVKDILSTKERDSYKEILYAIKDTAVINSITTDRTSPQSVNSAVNITAEAVGSSNILYRFWIYDGSNWSIVQNYSKSNSYKWIPSKTGSHRIWVDVKDQNSTNDVDSYKQIFYDVNAVSISELKGDKLSPQPTGQTIKFTAIGNGSNNLLYRFWILDNIGWKIVQDYSTSNTYNWVPNNTGNYRIWVDIKSAGSARDYDAYKEIVYSIKDMVVVNDILRDKQSPQTVNETINFTADAVGSSNILYRFWIHDGSNWTIVQNYSKEKTYKWTPSKPGIYRIWVDARSANSSNEVDSYKEVIYEIKKFNSAGNTQDNINNLGFTAIEGDNLYYVSNEGTLKKKRFSTGEIKQILSKDVMFINVIKDKVYFRDNSDGGLYEVDTNGSSVTKIASGNITYINAIGDWIYYCDNASTGTVYYKYNVLSKQKEKVIDLTTSKTALNIVAESDWIYFIESDTLAMYKMKSDGTLKSRVGNDAVGGFAKNGQWIYYINVSDGGRLYKISIDGTSRSLVDSNKVIALNSKSEWIYYSTAVKMSDTMQDVKLYKISSNGTAKTLVIDDVALLINVMDNYIYYIDGQGRTCQVRLDGTVRNYIE